jgi:F0F1-type ATP synthase epsilon subunit
MASLEYLSKLSDEELDDFLKEGLDHRWKAANDAKRNKLIVFWVCQVLFPLGTFFFSTLTSFFEYGEWTWTVILTGIAGMIPGLAAWVVQYFKESDMLDPTLMKEIEAGLKQSQEDNKEIMVNAAVEKKKFDEAMEAKRLENEALRKQDELRKQELERLRLELVHYQSIAQSQAKPQTIQPTPTPSPAPPKFTTSGQ